mmetsp:Transcript_356/g.875  ORF Transcript_356/g.875 Transcript_356/m.875 type:complete len:308 (+) Transcript_356:1486-2409(+)
MRTAPRPSPQSRTTVSSPQRTAPTARRCSWTSRPSAGSRRTSRGATRLRRRRRRRLSSTIFPPACGSRAGRWLATGSRCSSSSSGPRECTRRGGAPRRGCTTCTSREAARSRRGRATRSPAEKTGKRYPRVSSIHPRRTRIPPRRLSNTRRHVRRTLRDRKRRRERLRRRLRWRRRGRRKRGRSSPPKKPRRWPRPRRRWRLRRRPRRGRRRRGMGLRLPGTPGSPPTRTKIPCTIWIRLSVNIRLRLRDSLATFYGSATGINSRDALSMRWSLGCPRQGRPFGPSSSLRGIASTSYTSNALCCANM